MSDRYTEVTSQSWFSRIGSSIKGIFFGFILFIVAFPLLFWNEGRAVKRYIALEEGANQVISVDSASVDPANEGKLIHTHGNVASKTKRTDPLFGVSEEGLQLFREVQMYQWKESQNSKTEKKLGGGTETVTTYDYHKTWSSSVINSSGFKIPGGHENPTSMPYDSKTWTAEDAQMGGFKLSSSQVSSMSSPASYTPTTIPSQLKDKASLSGNSIYFGNPSNPQIGDVKVSFRLAPAAQGTIVAQQVGNHLSAFSVKTGSIQLIERGVVGVDAVFQRAENSNAMMTWVLRLIGFLMMYFGLSMILRILSVIGDLIPFVGTLIGMGTNIVSFLVAAPLTFITIAVAWIFYRPLIGILLIVLAVACIAGFKFVKPKMNDSTEANAATSPASS